jgi:thiamine pyrophosphokinase
MRDTALVFAGGDGPAPSAVADLDPDARVIAADSGLDHALALGIRVHVVVGDLDSVTESGLRIAIATGATVEQHPIDKDATDLELAMLSARDHGAKRVTVFGGGGGRHDLLLANALVLANDAFADMTVDAVVGTARITVIRERADLRGPPDSLCSLLPVGGTAFGVRTTGLRYPLNDEDLTPGSTRGISNELINPDASVTLRGGVLLALQADAFPLSPSPAMEI